MGRKTIADQPWSGSYGSCNNLRVDVDGYGFILAHSDHSIKVINRKTNAATFSVEYNHSLQKKNEVGVYKEIENDTIPVQPDNGDFNVDGNSEKSSSDLSYKTTRESDYQGEEGGEYRLAAYTGLRPVTAGYDGSVDSQDTEEFYYFRVEAG
ncbi:MAG: hypothetical protein OXT74_02590 [Candidatus Poribacteria bacterium]|nr:hypothetical protein [Candidatus Poribacteria bacterium]